jgi:putative membrane protein
MSSNNGGMSIVAGAIGGLVASLAMNQFQAAISAISESAAKKERVREGIPEPQPKPKSTGDDATVKAANAISTTVFDHELTDHQKIWAGPAVHYAVGATFGALYGTLATATEVDAFSGTAYGTALWLAADEIGVPLAGLSGPPAETPLSGHFNALASHLVFGLVTHFTRKLVLS